MLRSVRRASLCCMAIVAFASIGFYATKTNAQGHQSGCNSGTPYCPQTVSVPCSTTACITWAASGLSGGAPPCAELIEGGTQASTHLIITKTATTWSLCEASSNDSAQCENDSAACATYQLFARDDCTNACPLDYTYTYCKSGLNNCPPES